MPDDNWGDKLSAHEILRFLFDHADMRLNYVSLRRGRVTKRPTAALRIRPTQYISSLVRKGFLMNATLTINEVAHIARVPPRTVEKAIETGIMKPVKRRAMRFDKPTRLLDTNAVCYFAVIGHSKVLSAMTISGKRALMKAIRDSHVLGLKPIDVEQGLQLDLPAVAGEKLNFALVYVADRQRFITADPEIFGGVPIIEGTRLPVYAVSSRLADGDTLDDLVEDYPYVPREAFAAADVYARTHPERGRPTAGGRPWAATPKPA